MNLVDLAVTALAQTYESLDQHLLQWPEGLGFFGNFVAIVAYFRKTMIPLRIIAIASNVILIVFGVLAPSYPTLTANLILLVLNINRLGEMVRLVKRVEAATSDDFSIDWLSPFMTTHRISAGTLLFSSGDTATSLYLIVSGKFVLEETGIEIAPGTIVGELGMLSPSRQRTQSLRCVEGGEIRSITYNQVEQLYFQNPEFGFYFLRLASERLFLNLERMERRVKELSAPQDLAASGQMEAAS